MFNTSRKYKKDIKDIDLEYPNSVQHVVNTYNPGSQKEYWYFRRNTYRKKDKNLTETEYGKIVRAIYQAVKELMLEYEGGVFLKRYGYFSLLIIPYMKQKGIKIGKYYYDSLTHTEGYRYVPILDTDVTTVSCINKMIMDRAYNVNTRGEFWKLIEEEGFRPKNYYTSLKSIFAHKNANIK